MALLDGKQLRDTTTSLDKLNGTGVVEFTSATMSFGTGSVITTLDANIVNGLDVVNKNYVDAVAAGLNPKEASRAIYLGDVTSEGGYTYSNGTGGVGATLQFTAVSSLNTDGVTLGGTDRVIINSSTDQFVNGIYTYTNATTLTRSTDFDGSPSSEVDGGEYSFVKEGTLYADTGWVVSSPDTTATIGTTNIVWTQFSSAGTIQAGDGLTKTGNTLDVGAGTGLTVSSTQVSIDNTGVVSATYGAGNTIPTFNVNAQGQLTSATDVLIDITSGQINNFTASSESVIFTDANFVDGSSVTFSVTAGNSVTAEVVDGSLGTVKLDTNGAGATAGYILSNDGAGNFTWILNDVGDITEVTAGAGLTGGGTTGAINLDVRAENGLTVDGTSDAVELGGALTKNTTISGSGFDFTVGDAGSITMTSSGGVFIEGASFSVNSVEIDPTSAINGYVLTFDGTKFLPQAVAGTGDITEVIAGNGLIGGATAGSATLNVVGGTGINANPDDIEIDFLAVASGLQGNGLTANSGVLDVNVGTGLVINSDVVEADFTSLASNLQGNGLTANGGVLDVNVNADSLEIVGDVIRLKDTVTGNRTFANNLTVQGDAQIDGNLTVSGTATYVHTENLYVEDNIITLNATFSGIPFLDSGIEVNRGTFSYATLLWDESQDYWVAGLSGSESIIIQEAGGGISKSGNKLSADLTTNGGLTFSTTGDSGTLEVLVDNSTIQIVNGELVATSAGDIEGLTAGAGLIGGGSTGFLQLDVELTTNGGLTFSTTGDSGTLEVDEPNLDYTTIAGNLDGAGLVVVGSELAVNTGLGMTISGDTIATDLSGTGGLTYSGNQLVVDVDGSTIQIIGNQLVATTAGDIEGLTAGAGLVGGGSTGFLQLDVDLLVNGGLTFSTTGDAGELKVDAASIAGDGLTTIDGTTLSVQVGNGIIINSDTVEINPTAAGDGLTFSTGVFAVNVANGLQISGDNVEVAPSIAGTGLTFSAGVLSLNPTASAVPYYGDRNKTPNTTAPNTDDENSGITITNTPNDYSRVQVYVNGQLQYLGDNTTTADCYFGTTGSAVAISDITAGQTLYWNGQDAGFRLTATDRVDIIYEV